MILLLAKNYIIEYGLIWIFYLSIVTNGCFFFAHDVPLYYHKCEIYAPAYIFQFNYQKCLNCLITSARREKVNDTWRNICAKQYDCIELRFYNSKAFEYFFKHYYYLLKEFFKKLTIESDMYNTLFITVRRDHYQELNLTYLQSIIKSNGIDYSYLSVFLTNSRQNIVLDLESGLSSIPLSGIQIRISCNKHTILNYYVSRHNQNVMHSNACVTIASVTTKRYSNSNRTTTNSSVIISTKTSRVTIANIFLFISGLTIFLICIFFIFLNLYMRYDKWKKSHNYNQRSSIVLSTLSADSFDTLKDDTSPF